MNALSGPATRRYDLDWVRVFAVLGIFAYHSSRFFDFVTDKVLRLLVPLLVGVFSFSIVQVYLERLSHGQFARTLFQFIPHYFEGQYSGPGAGPGNFAWHGMHLWYLLFLFVYTLLLMPLFWWFRSQAGSRALRRMGDLLALPGALLLLVVPTVLLQHVTATGALLGNIDLGGWTTVPYLWFFLAGFLLESHAGVQRRIWRYLDPIVQWTGELGMYAIIDWHYIGNIATGEGSQMPDLADRPRDLSLAFWRVTARYFRNAPHVSFEVYNELASMGAAVWRQSVTELVQRIRVQGAQQLVIVGGVEYGRDLSWVMGDPVPDANLAYASHIYPSHPASGCGTWFGQVSERYPVLITAWGFMDENRNPRVSYLSGDRQSYAQPFLAYLQERGIGWVACWYDDEWESPLFQAGWKSGTRWGEFVLAQLKR